MTADEKLFMAKSIYEAFVEGWNSYATPACAYNTAAQAWEESSAKVQRDQLVKEAMQMKGIK